MAADDNRSAAIDFVQALSDGAIARIEELLHPEVTPPERFAGLGDSGFERMVNGLRRVHAAFGRCDIAVDDTVMEGDMVAVRQTIDATHTGDLYGLPATGKDFTIEEMMFFRFRDGKVIETWNVADRLAMMQQLGVAESTPRWEARPVTP
jgi:predicted ester cyclase